MLNRLLDRLGNPLEWSLVDRCLVVISVPLVFGVPAFFGYGALVRRLDKLTYVDGAAAGTQMTFIVIFFAIFFILMLAAFILRRRPGEHRWFAHVVAQFASMSVAEMCYAFGPLTHPIILVVGVGIGVYFLLFDWSISLPGLTSFVLILLLSLMAAHAGLIPYAPFFRSTPFSGGEIDGFYFVSGTLFVMTLILIMATTTGYTILRWRDREDKLAQATAELKDSLERLEKTQEQLVVSEKMAALGGLVGGVAHEINTPVGVAVTAASLLDEKTLALAGDIASATLKRSDLDNYVRVASESSAMILANLKRASDIIHSFKQVAVDQSSEEKRSFNLKDYLEDVLLSLYPALKKTNHTVEVACPEDLTLESFPGAVSQIVTNLVMNSLVHGFEDRENGVIRLEVSETDEGVVLNYSDNGKGMDRESLKKVFEPFYTTKRTKGGSGLGMHIVYNLATQALGGRIDCESAPGEGVCFILTIPTGE